MKTRLVLFAMLAAAPPLLLALFAPFNVQAEPPKILDFRTQEVNQKIYFHLRIARPADMVDENVGRNRRFDPWGDMPWSDPMLRPRLVPEDENARLVYTRETLMDRFGRFGFDKDGPFFADKKEEPPKDPPPPKDGFKDKDDKKECDAAQKDIKVEEVKDKAKPKDDFDFKEKDFPVKDGPRPLNGRDNNVIEFYGVFTGKNAATFILLYPKETNGNEFKPKKEMSLHEMLERKNQWVEEKIVLDPAKAKKVPMPPGGFRRQQGRVDANDLEGNWALGQATHFSMLSAETSEFGYYTFARETTQRQFGVLAPEPPWRPWFGDRFGGKHELQRTYEITTGAAAITESLALNRLRDRGGKEVEQPRTIPIGKVQGIDIAEHPWVKMMGDKKPAAEPLARLIPHDNYYIAFRTFDKFLEFGDLLDEWGTSVARAYEVNSRDHRIKQKLEQQVCLKSTGLARVFGPAVIKSLAITGNDPYLREGSDFTIIFQVTNKTVFETGAEPNIAAARKKHGKDLKEGKSVHNGVAIESFTTPLREVSLHRAYFDDYAVFSNSEIAVRRVIDANKGKIKRLTDQLDFQYMRTVFRADDKAEDGFVFLSDAFIRNLVGPQVRIKERRRLEALTSMSMVTHGAMYTGWMTGKPAQNFDHILQTTGMNPNELFTLDGNAVTWDDQRKVAISSFYNTLHFATPLIEIPIDNVTEREAAEYENFRRQYLGLWRQFFDPIGVRLALDKKEIKTEVYILPLINTSEYNQIRRVAGGGTIKVDESMFSDKALVKYLMHLSPDLFGAGGFFGGGGELFVDVGLRSWLGDWFTIRLDDSPVYQKLLESYIRSQMFPEERHDFVRDMELGFQIPLTIGFDVRSPVIFAGVLAGVRQSVQMSLPGAVEWGPMKDDYKGVKIVRIKADGEQLNRRGISGPDSARINPTFYYAMVDGAFFISLKEEPIKDLIDRSVALKDKKAKGESVEVNTTLHIGPKAAVQSKDLLKLYLEYESHRRAQVNNRLLYALYKSNVVAPGDDSDKVEAACLQYLGFVPVSPDLAPFRYEPLKEEVVNLRHGSVRQPRLAKGIDANSPMSKMLEQFASIRADLRFREDGIHTTLTMRRNLPK